MNNTHKSSEYLKTIVYFHTEASHVFEKRVKLWPMSLLFLLILLIKVSANIQEQYLFVNCNLRLAIDTRIWQTSMKAFCKYQLTQNLQERVLCILFFVNCVHFILLIFWVRICCMVYQELLEGIEGLFFFFQKGILEGL